MKRKIIWRYLNILKMNVKSFSVSFSNAVIILLLKWGGQAAKNINAILITHFPRFLFWRMYFCDPLRARYYRGRAALSSGRTAFSGENNPLRPVRISTLLLRPLVVR